MVQYCVAYGCTNLSDKRSDIQFHRFPFNRPETLKLWIIALRREKWTPTKTSRLCSQHFLENDYEECSNITTKGKLLKPTAVPTVFNYPKHLLKSSDSRRILKRQHEAYENKENDVPCKVSREEIPECTKYVDRASSPIIIHSPTRQVLRRKIKTLNQKIRRRNKKITSMQGLISELSKKGRSNESLKMILENHFSGFPLDFLLQQKKNAEASATHKIYNESMKMFAHTLYFYSPKAYRFVRSQFHLPSPRTLRNWLSKCKCNPGFLQEIFDYLKLESQSKEHLKHCGLIFDSMSIRKQISYDVHEDKYSGYSDYGGIVDANPECPASEALMFQIVSYKNNFKCPVAYFTINKIDANVQAGLIKACIVKLFECGIIIHSVTCDGAPVNINTLNILGANLVANKLVPYFKHPVPECSTRIHCMLDACHMLKLARNTMGEKNMHSDKGPIRWLYLQKLNNIQQEEDLKLANSLSSRHIFYKNKIMNVRLASQTLSSSIANALQFLCSTNKNFSDAEATIEFIRLIDRIFDALNSRNPFGKGFKAPIRPQTLHVFEDVFSKAQEYLKTLKIENISILQHPRKTFALGFIVTMQSTLNLAKDLFKMENPLSYLLTYKCSQDHLELFFSCIRSRGGWNNNPNSMQLKWALRQLLFKNSIKPSVNGNAIDVECQSTSLFEFRSVTRSISVEKEHSTDTNEYDCERLLAAIDSIELSDFVENVLYYIAGYVVRKIIPRINCEHCIKILFTERDGDHMYARNNLTFQRFTGFISHGGLIFVSNIIFNIVTMTEKHFRIMRAQGLQKNRNFMQALQSSVTKHFSSKLSEFIPTHPLIEEFIAEDLHELQLVKTIVSVYAKLRLHTHAKKLTENLQGNSIRQKFTKLILFSNV